MLLRHAKSSHDDASLKDYDRPLAGRGRRDAPRMGRFVKEVEALPEYVLSSPAKRAEQTTRLFIESAGIDPSLVIWEKDLYYGGARDYLHLIQKTPGKINEILLVGHNPLLEETVSLLCNEQGTRTVRMPTAALVCIEHSGNKWTQIKPGTARFKWMMIPKLLNKLK